MDTRQLHYILEIAECGNITKAAEKLYISQSGLNQQLLRIEKELGATLFERSTHSFKITETGELIAEYAHQAIYNEKRVLGMIKDLKDGGGGELHINLAMEQGVALFCEIYPRFVDKYPRVTLKLEDHTVKEQYDLILKNRLDIGMVMITHKELPQLEYIHLGCERFLLGVPQSIRSLRSITRRVMATIRKSISPSAGVRSSP